MAVFNLKNYSLVIKNTASLYIRMVVLTVISLFTVRIVLQSLGVENYGLYNVVAGFVSMFAFVSGTLTIATQRYFAISLADNNWVELNKIYSINIVIYLLASIVIIILSQTLGIWFVLQKLVIPENRIFACIVVYELSVLSFIIGFLTCPYLALLVADENISIYSTISVGEGLLKIAIAYCIYNTKWDKLILYSVLNTLVAIIINGIYFIYVFITYKQLKFKFSKNISEYKSIALFLNWNLIGAVAYVFKSQGINIIMNMFFGALINAARGIAFQVSSVVVAFSQNFMKAIDPQITKSFAKGDKNDFIKIIFVSSKVSFYLLYIIALPLILNMNYVLGIWLVSVPKFAVPLTILALVDALILAVTDSIFTAVQSVGKVKWYQITVGGLSLLNLPISYILLQYVHDPLLPSVVCIVISFAMTVTRLVNIKVIYEFPVILYLQKVITPLLLVVAASSLISYIFFSSASGFIELCVFSAACVILIFLLIIILGITNEERNVLKNIIFVKLLRKGC